MTKQLNTIIIFSFFIITGLLISAINPHDYFTWFLEVAPAIIVLLILLLTYKSFPLSNLLYTLIVIHAYILFIGGHYTYAKVPLFDWIKDYFHQERNNFDKLGHFAQGFVPAIAAREILLRKMVVDKKAWLSFIIISICLAFSAFYELIEAFVAIATGDSAEAFLGTQGYVWDTQTDMFLALVGSVTGLIVLPKIHDHSLAVITREKTLL